MKKKTSPLPKTEVQVSTEVEESFSTERETHIAPLTPKEKNVLEFIENYISESGTSPSYQEIKDHFGLASYNSVQNYLKQLTNKGYVHIPSHQKRAIQILHSAKTVQKNVQQLASVSTKIGSQRSLLLQAREEILSLPLLGRVAAGQPIEAITHQESIQVPPHMVRNPSLTYILQVQGDSMIEDGIWDGDYILVEKRQHAKNGDIIVATVDNEATVKRFYFKQHQDPNENHLIELRPANSKMKSMWYSPSEVNIRGLVVGLMRKFETN